MTFPISDRPRGGPAAHSNGQFDAVEPAISPEDLLGPGPFGKDPRGASGQGYTPPATRLAGSPFTGVGNPGRPSPSSSGDLEGSDKTSWADLLRAAPAW